MADMISKMYYFVFENLRKVIYKLMDIKVYGNIRVVGISDIIYDVQFITSFFFRRKQSYPQDTCRICRKLFEIGLNVDFSRML